MMTTRSKPKHRESEIQRAFVTWFNLQHPTKMLFAIPNGGARSKIEAAIMKGEGVVPGVGDTFLMFGNSHYYGLFIEFKAGDNKQSEKQKEFEQYCIQYKYKYVVCWSVEEGIHEVTEYLKLN